MSETQAQVHRKAVSKNTYTHDSQDKPVVPEKVHVLFATIKDEDEDVPDLLYDDDNDSDNTVEHLDQFNINTCQATQDPRVLAGRKYKKVDVRVRRVPGVFPQEATVHRQFPNDPLENLPPLPRRPPKFIPTSKLTEERMKSIGINSQGFLWPEEEKLFQHIILLNEDAMAFIQTDRGTFKKSYFTDYIIPTIEHIPWSFKNIPIPPGIKNDVMDLLKEKIDAGVYKQSQLSYRARWFCVPKKSGKLRIVHDLQPLNKVTIRDAGLPPIVDDFVEPFAGHQCYTVFDLFWGFDGRKIHPKS
jgi:hypothetical protein